MLRAKDYKTLSDKREELFSEFRRLTSQGVYSDAIGDLSGYFTEDNVIIDGSKKHLSFEVGDYKFTMQSVVSMSENNKNDHETNSVLFRTYENISDLSRLKPDVSAVRHIPSLDIKIFFANKKGMGYGSDRFTYSMDGAEKSNEFSKGLLDRYCKNLIKYIEDLENPKDNFYMMSV